MARGRVEEQLARGVQAAREAARLPRQRRGGEVREDGLQRHVEHAAQLVRRDRGRRGLVRVRVRARARVRGS